MAGFFEVANWREYQHYTKRNPPWIKLHYSTLSGQTWVMLDDASRVLAVACMLIASRNDGRVPADPAFVQRVAYLNAPPSFKPLIDSGFLIDASGLLADASALQATARPETEKRRDREETDTSAQAQRAMPFSDFWDAWPSNRRQGKADAQKAWGVLKPDLALLNSMRKAIATQIQSDQWKRGIIPLPATWLRGRRWEDELPSSVDPVGKGEPDWFKGAI